MTQQPKPQIPLLDLDLLRTLVVITEAGSFSAASNIVLRTPSAISMQVKRIEDVLGHRIFTRLARSVSLTEDGELLIAHARRVLALNRDIVAKFITPEVSGIVRLGALDHAAELFLPSVLRRFSETHPGITVDVSVENTKPLIEKFKQKQLDIIIITCKSAGAAVDGVETLYHERLVWAGLKNGIAAEQDPLPVSVWEEGCVWRDEALLKLEKQNREYRETFKSAYISGQKAALQADLAVAPLPETACGADIVELGPQYNLPTLSDYALGMLLAKDAGAHIDALADHLRATFADKS